LLGWNHLASHGRDHHVEVIRKYFCYPDGIPVTLIKESARHFEAGDNHEGAGAFIRIRLLVRRTEASEVTLSSEMPFVTEVIPEQELPPIDLDPSAGAGGELLPHHDGWIDPDPNGMKWKAFWPLVRGQKRKFKVSCTDHAGVPHEIQRSFILVSSSLLDAKTGRLSPADQSKVDAAWEKPSSLSDRSTDLLARRVAVAPPGKPNDTTITAYSLDLARAAFGPLPASGVAETPFEPRLHRLTVSSDCLSSLSGTSKPLPVSFRKFPGLSQDEARQASLSDRYKGILTPDAVDIPGQPYLGLEEDTDSGIGNEHARRFGGVVQPNVKIAAVGRETELVSGNVEKYLKNSLTPADLFSGAKLLGGIDLGSVLNVLPKQPPGWIFERTGGSPWDSVLTSGDALQGLQNAVQNDQTPDPVQSFVGWRASFDWSTRELKQFLLFNPTSKTELNVHSEITFEALSGKANWQSQATLRDFEIAIPSANTSDSAWIIIAFDEVSVSIQSGQAPLFSPRIKDGDDAIRFGKQLAFLDALRKLLKSEKGLSLDITGSYVAVRQTTNIPDKNLGTFAITGLTFTFGIRLPMNGEPLEAEFALGTISNPFTLSVSGYSGAGFFETVVTTKGTKTIAVSLEFGGDYAAKLLKDPDPNGRSSAAEALGAMRAKEYAAEVAKLLKDPNVHSSAAQALGAMRAEEYTAKLLKDPDPNVRRSAAQALWAAGQKYRDTSPDFVVLSDFLIYASLRQHLTHLVHMSR
jgi:HEAT repeats